MADRGRRRQPSITCAYVDQSAIAEDVLERLAMYDQRISIYCAPTADDRPTWLGTMQHIALEGRCFVLSACQQITRGAYGADYGCTLPSTLCRTLDITLV